MTDYLSPTVIDDADVAGAAKPPKLFTQVLLDHIPNRGGVDLNAVIKGALGDVRDIDLNTGEIGNSVKTGIMSSMTRAGVPFAKAAGIMSDDRITEAEALYVLAKMGNRLPIKTGSISQHGYEAIEGIAEKYGTQVASMGMTRTELASGITRVESAVENSSFMRTLSMYKAGEFQKPVETSEAASERLGETLVAGFRFLKSGGLGNISDAIPSAPYTPIPETPGMKVKP